MIWKKECTWENIRKTYGFMKQLKFRTQFVQAAFAECYIASKLSNAGYDVRFHENSDSDLTINFSNLKVKNFINIEVKHSEDNKDQYPNGHGYSSWVISKPQVEQEKFDLAILVREGLKKDGPNAVYVFTRKEIAKTPIVDVNPPKMDYYMWYSDYYEEINERSNWMKSAANSLVESLNTKPDNFEKRWDRILSGNIQLIS